MVRRFVEQEQCRPPQQNFGERDAHLPSARKRLGRPDEIRLSEAEAFEHLRHAQIDRMAVVALKQISQVVVSDEQRLVLAVGQRRICQSVLDAFDLGFRIEQALESRRRFVEERAAGVLEPVLRQIPNRETARFDDIPAIRLVESRENPQQRRLARAVRAGKTDTIAVIDLPGDIVEEHAFAEALGQA
jgi:hypothetical protein